MEEIFITLVVILFFLSLGFFLQRYVKRWTHFEERKTIGFFEKITKNRDSAKNMYKFYRIIAVFIIIALFFILSNNVFD